jgi:hypothetical protein
MKIAELSQVILDDLCDEQRWRLDIDPGFDAKHEFWLSWRHFLTISDWAQSQGISEDDVLADFITVEYHGASAGLQCGASGNPVL